MGEDKVKGKKAVSRLARVPLRIHREIKNGTTEKIRQKDTSCIPSKNGYECLFYGMWLSLVERSVRDAEAGGSNPLIPTRKFKGLRA